MRVTNQMMSRNLLRNLNRNMQDMQDYQDQLSTGKKVQDPSDGPVAVTKIVKYKSDIRALEQYDKNAKDALSFTETSELAIADITDALDRARELAVQGANGTNSEEETKAIAKEIKQLKNHIIGEANKTFAGKYIFSGFHTDEKLLNDDGTYNFDVTNVDTDQTPQTTYEVGVGEDIKVSTNGLDLFGLVEKDTETKQILENMSVGKAKGNDLEHSYAKLSDIDTSNYTGNFSVDVGGTTFDQNHDAEYSTKSELISHLETIEDGSGNQLSESANVYFNTENELIIESKNDGEEVENITHDGLLASGSVNYQTEQTATNAKVGPDFDEKVLTDTMIQNSNEEIKFKFSYNGVEKEVALDLSQFGAGDNLSDAFTENGTSPTNSLQEKIDNAFSGVTDYATGDIIVNVENDGTNDSLSFSGKPESGEPSTLDVKVIKGNKSQLMQDLDDFITALESNDQDGMGKFISDADKHLDNLNSERSIIGAKTNRMELILSRIEDDNINVTQLLSNAQDVDMSEAIMNLKNRENVYRAALSTGAKTIQPSLIDFLR